MSNAPLLPPIFFQLYFFFCMNKDNTTNQNQLHRQYKWILIFKERLFFCGMKLKNQENRRNENVEWILLAMSSIILYRRDYVCACVGESVCTCVCVCFDMSKLKI